LRNYKGKTCRPCILSFINSNRMMYMKEVNLIKVTIKRTHKRENMNKLSKSKRKTKRRNIRYSNYSKTFKPANSWLAPPDDR
jgi:hypothetical protein